MSVGKIATNYACAAFFGIGMMMAAQGANAGCQGKHIISSNLQTLKFFGADGKTVVATKVGKTTDHSLNIEILDCDDTYFYVVLEGGVAAEVLRTDVGIDSSLCAPDEKAVAMRPDTMTRGAATAFDGNVKCEKK